MKTRQQAEKLLKAYVLPEAREKYAEQIEYSLNELFEEQQTTNKGRESER